MSSKAMKIDIGISAKDREVIADGLARLLADSYTLYLQSHNFHWNVTGPMFQTLHVLFMEHYTEQWNALDLIAERIRSLGLPAPGTYKEFSRLSSINEVEGTPSATETRAAFAAAEAANDQPTCDLLTQRMQVHEKNAWMLRSLLEDGR
jgi:starvation-inducible DNA-binding protein